MNKILNKVQKPLIWAFLIISALVLISALCYSTKYVYIVPSSGNTSKEVYPKINSANNFIFYTSIISIVLFAVLCIAGNKYRKQYYISNLVVGCASFGVSFALLVVSIIFNISALSAISDNNTKLVDEVSQFEIDKIISGEEITIQNGFAYFALVICIIAAVVAALGLAFTVLKFISSKKDLKEIKATNLKEVGE